MNKTDNMKQYWRGYRFARAVLKAALALGFKAEAKGPMVWIYGLLTYDNRVHPAFYTVELEGKQAVLTRHISKQGARLKIERNPATAGDLRKPNVLEVWAKGERFRPDTEGVTSD